MRSALSLPLIALSLFLSSATLRPEIRFVDSGQSLGTGLCSQVVLGDIDGDGDLDAVTAMQAGENSAIWSNQGGSQAGAAGTFLMDSQILSSNLAVAVALADMDGDHDLDIILQEDGSTETIRIWINLGGFQGGTLGTFQSNGQSIGDELSGHVAVGDLDGNGSPDAFISHYLARPNKVWFNDGTAKFTVSSQILGSSITSALGDLDGDGDLDAFVGTDGPNQVWMNAGGAQMGVPGAFTESGQNLGTSFSISIALGDLDGDSDLDAFTAGSTTNQVWINAGNGIFASNGQSLNAGLGQSRGVALGDMDRDGDLDVILARANPAVFENLGGATFPTVPSIDLPPGNLEAIALGDLDGDGDLDAFVASGGSKRVWWNQSTSVRFQLRDTSSPRLFVNDPLPLFPLIELIETQPVQWDGAILSLEITGNFGPTDSLRIATGIETSGGGFEDELLSFHGAIVGSMPGTLGPRTSVQITLNTNATSEAVSAILKSFRYHWSFSGAIPLGAHLSQNPFHLEADREIMLQLRTLDGAQSVIRKSIELNRLIGIRIIPSVAFVGRAFGNDSHTFRCEGVLRSGILSLATQTPNWSISDDQDFDLTFVGSDPTVTMANNFPFGGASTVIYATLNDFSASAELHGNAQVLDCLFVFQFKLRNLLPVPFLPKKSAAAPEPPPIEPTLFRSLEALLNQTDKGRRLAGLYRRHAREVVQMIINKPELLPQITEVLRDFQPGVVQLLNGHGANFQIAPALIDRLNMVWDQLIPLAGPELKNVLQTERDRFPNFSAFSGKNFNEWSALLETQIPGTPFVYASNPQLTPNEFLIEVNHIDGATYTLHFATDVTAANWSIVPNATINRTNSTVFLKDLAPSSNRIFYQVKAAASP